MTLRWQSWWLKALMILWGLLLVPAGAGAGPQKTAADYLAAGKEQVKAGKLTDAVASFTKALELEPDSTAARFQRGNAYVRLEKYGKAIEDYTEVIRRDPQHGKAYHNRALAYWFAGDLVKADEDLKKAESLGIQINHKAWRQLFVSPSNPPTMLDLFRPEREPAGPAPAPPEQKPKP